MSIATTRELVADAVARRVGLAAINVITLEHAEAIADAASAAGVPVIMQISENAVRYHGGRLEPIALATAALARQASVPVSLHLDHVTDEALADAALGSVFSSIMYDAGALPYAENVARTRRVAQAAHEAGLWIEAELGYVGGKPDQVQSAHSAGVRTDPEEAARYVSATGVDALAVAVGSSHAMTNRSASIDLDLVSRLHARLAVPLVLHGSSGVPAADLPHIVAAGITKVNVGTALNIALTTAIRFVLADDALVDPRKYLGPGRDAMTRAVCELLRDLNAPQPGGQRPGSQGETGACDITVPERF
ncbi:fructose-bisphosphate aldolase [Jatrophihabitans sp. GAS493]|uniref:class II fructose-bisphosphate aldolase n=1 Tax=Jatrophihabitans sp. GAS493 TaxID=1907575 RepID=UPI000BB7F73C|nr:class II fructose-bisphosphate aldolase [Jatrophihabitans sp. GAS493]SOD74871.1 fructose-bisphosphate aldolase [Jatrophihabitans sp. GAS493]